VREWLASQAVGGYIAYNPQNSQIRNDRRASTHLSE
jgi:hypothetical protein